MCRCKGSDRSCQPVSEGQIENITAAALECVTNRLKLLLPPLEAAARRHHKLPIQIKMNVAAEP